MADDDEGRLVGLVGRADGDGAVAGPFDERSHFFVRRGRGRWRRCVGVREYGKRKEADEEKSDDKEELHLVSAIAAESARDNTSSQQGERGGREMAGLRVGRRDGYGSGGRRRFTMTQFRRRCRLAVQFTS